MALAASNQAIVQDATVALRAAITDSTEFAKWIGFEAVQQGLDLQTAINIVHEIEAGHYTLDDLFIASQTKTFSAIPTDIAGEPNPSLTVLGYSFDIGHLLGATTVETWQNGTGKSSTFHSREYFTTIGTDAPDNYVDVTAPALPLVDDCVNIVENSTFQDVDFSNSQGGWLGDAVIPHWTNTGDNNDGGIEIWNQSMLTANNGLTSTAGFVIETDGWGNGTLDPKTGEPVVDNIRTEVDALTGKLYDITFNYAARGDGPGGTTDGFDVLWNGKMVGHFDPEVLVEMDDRQDHRRR